jgi:hypothetical protein
MKKLMIAATLLLASFVMAQQTAPPPYAPPPHETPLPQDPGQQKPNQGTPDVSPNQMPPDTQVPGSSEVAVGDMQRQIEQKLQEEPMMSGANVSVSVDDKAVTLQGVVDSDKQHDLAMHIAQGYAGNRPVVDKLTVRQKS